MDSLCPLLVIIGWIRGRAVAKYSRKLYHLTVCRTTSFKSFRNAQRGNIFCLFPWNTVRVALGIPDHVNPTCHMQGALKVATHLAFSGFHSIYTWEC